MILSRFVIFLGTELSVVRIDDLRLRAKGFQRQLDIDCP
jgi:hypothetical protein